MSTPAVTPIFAPDGTIHQIPNEQVPDAMSAGGKLAVQMKSPAGDLRYVPHDQVRTAQLAGGKVNTDQGTPDAPKPAEGFWHSLGSVFGLTPEKFDEAQKKAANMSPLQEALSSTAPPNPVDVAKSAGTAVKNEFQKGSQEGQDSYDALQHGDIKGFLAHQIGQVGHAAATVAAPVFGENLSKAGEQLGEGNIKGALGTTTGLIAPIVAGGALSKDTPETALENKPPTTLRNNPVVNTVLGKDPEAIPAADALTKAVRPRNSIKDFDVHADRALPDARRAADSMGIDVNKMTIQDAEKSVTQAKKDVWQEFQEQHLGPGGNIGVDATPVADRINGAVDNMSSIQKRRMASTVDEAKTNAQDYDGKTLTLNDIEDRIQELNNQLRTKQNTFKVNEQALRNDPQYAHQFAELDGLRQLERQSFDAITGPGSAALKQRYGSLKVLEDVIDRRIPVVERQNAAGLYETAGRIAGLGDMAGGVVARDFPRVVAGAVKMRAGQNAALMNNPDFLIQQAFKKTTPRGAIPAAPEAIPPKGLLEQGPVPLGPGEDTSGSVPDAQVPPTNYTSRAQRKGLLLNAAPEDAPPAPPEPSPAEVLQSIRSRSKLAYDPSTRRMVRQYPVDSAANGATIEGDAIQQAQPAGSREGQAVSEQVRPGSEAAPGSATSVRVPGEDRSYAARYQVRELADVQPSHSGVTFQPNQKYALTNDRDYSNAVNQGKVITNSAPGKFDPSYHITDNPDATNGPIVVDSDGHALGGNGRAMILDRVYRYNQQGAAAYKDMLAQKATQFGIDPAEVAKMKQPVLVREINDSEFQQPQSKQSAITDFNKKGTAELTPSERAITDSRRVSQKTLDSIAGKFDERGPDTTLADVLRGSSGTDILDRLINEGVVTPQERAALAGKNELTEAGKERIGKLMVGRFFRDPAQIDSTAPVIRGKLERLAAPVARVDGLGQWDITPKLQEAMDVLEEATAHKVSTVDDLLRQKGLFGDSNTYSADAITLAKRLKADSATSLVKAARQYAQDAADSQRSLLGPGISQEQAFKEAFGGKPPSKSGEPPGQTANTISKPPDQGGFSLAQESTAHGAGGASVEELARGETFWRIKKNGQLSYQGVSPDANLGDGEALVAINKSTGKMRVQDQRMGLGDEALLGKFGNRVKAAANVQPIDLNAPRAQRIIPPDVTAKADVSGKIIGMKSDETGSPDFQKWFSGSKVADSEGKPLTVYHGTKEPFDRVDMSKGAQGTFWLTTDKAAIERGESGATSNAHVLEAHVSIKNPAGWDEYENKSIDELIRDGYDGVILPEGGHSNIIAFEPEQVRFIKGNAKSPRK